MLRFGKETTEGPESDRKRVMSHEVRNNGFFAISFAELGIFVRQKEGAAVVLQGKDPKTGQTFSRRATYGEMRLLVGAAQLILEEEDDGELRDTAYVVAHCFPEEDQEITDNKNAWLEEVDRLAVEEIKPAKQLPSDLGRMAIGGT